MKANLAEREPEPELLGVWDETRLYAPASLNC
jgi:hypothetical protein